MIALEKQVCSLEISKELKAAGYPQEGLWWWLPFNGGEPDARGYQAWLANQGEADNWEEEIPVVAPTVAELGEALPKYYMSMHNGKGHWVCEDFDTYSHPSYKYDPLKTEADARGRMWLYLKKENLI